jgi:hypothetical protein
MAEKINGSGREENTRIPFTVKAGAAFAKLGLVTIGLASEAKHLGVQYPQIINDNAADFIGPTWVALTSNYLLPGRIFDSRLVRYATGLSAGVGSELMQKADIWPGTFDMKDIAAFTTGAVVLYGLDRLSGEPEITPERQTIFKKMKNKFRKNKR